jgi:MFS family permease
MSPTSRPSRLFTRDEKKILLFTNAGHFLAHSIILIFPSIVSALAKELNLPFEQALRISFLMYLVYGIGALPSGLLTDRINPRFSLAIFFFGIGTSCFAVSFMRSSVQLKLALMTLGVFLSIYHPAGIGLISRSMKNRGMALGINGVYGSIGIASAPFLAGTINYLLDWRWIYRMIAVFPLVLGVLIVLTGLPEPVIRQETAAAEGSRNEKGSARIFLILCISMALAGFVYRGQTLLLPTYFEQKISFLYDLVKNVSLPKMEGMRILSATILTSFVYVISIFGQMIGGKIADRADLRYAYLLFFLGALPFVLMMYFFRDLPLLGSSIMFILLTIGMQPVENSLIAKITPLKWRNTSYGIKFTLTFGISSAVIYPIGFIQRTYSLSAVFLLFSGVIAVLVLNNLFLIVATRGRSIRNEASGPPSEPEPEPPAGPSRHKLSAKAALRGRTL